MENSNQKYGKWSSSKIISTADYGRLLLRLRHFIIEFNSDNINHKDQTTFCHTFAEIRNFFKAKSVSLHQYTILFIIFLMI